MSVFAGLLDRRCAVVEEPINDGAGLLPEEERQMMRAVPRRRAEFAAGRRGAREALAVLGEAECAIPSGPDRVPVWPAGYVGSITHTDRVCAVAVGRRSDGLLSVGLDLEPAEPLPADVLETVCLPRERQWLEAAGPDERDVFGRLIFSAKECAFKCQYAVSRTMLEFHDLSVEIDRTNGAFVARFLRNAASFFEGDELSGRFKMSGGLIACAMTLGDHDIDGTARP